MFGLLRRQLCLKVSTVVGSWARVGSLIWLLVLLFLQFLLLLPLPSLVSSPLVISVALGFVWVLSSVVSSLLAHYQCCLYSSYDPSPVLVFPCQKFADC